MKKYILSFLIVLFCLATTLGATAATTKTVEHGLGSHQIDIHVGESHLFPNEITYDPAYFEEVSNNGATGFIGLKAIKAGETQINMYDEIYDVHIT
ncbi:MAG: hypothetical protein NKF70_13120 [Methanobacterium sp. ERen5]|nr:MAG: hypothetical protein NKF70_13120 [Methanobacterium sp. ERen5]